MTMWRDKSGQLGNESGTSTLPLKAGTGLPLPDPSQPLDAQAPELLLAMCLFGEARGESDAAQRAVAQVVLNRALYPHSVFGSRPGAPFEENLRRVLLRPGQFSCFRPADPNYTKLFRPCEAEDQSVWQRCLDCAQQALAISNQHDTLTQNSDHYFDESIQPPSWADPAKRTVKIGRLNFYRLYLPAPRLELPAAPSAELPPSSDGQSDAAASNPRSTPFPAASQALSADPIPTQEPPKQEPSAGRPSPADGLVSGSAELEPRASLRGPSRDGVPHSMSLPRRIPHFAWNPRLPNMQRRSRTGRLSSLKAAASAKWRVTSCSRSAFDLFRKVLMNRFLLRSSLIACHLSLVLLLAGCSDFERAAYRTLAVTQAEYETVQRQVAEAAVHGLITEDQWNRFAAEGHRFIDAHNAAVDAFDLWSRSKSQSNEARAQALLEILPRLVRQLNNLAASFQSDAPVPSGVEPRPQGSGGDSGSNQEIEDPLDSPLELGI